VPSLWQRLTTTVTRSAHSPAWEAGVSTQADVMRWPDGERHHAKQGRSIGLFRFRSEHGQINAYVKRHFRISTLHGLVTTLFPNWTMGPGRCEQKNIETARSLGIPVPKVLAVGEHVGPWGRMQSYIAIEELPRMIALHEAIPLAAKRLGSSLFRDWKAGLVREVARLCKLLHDSGNYHCDLYLCHFFIDEAMTGVIPQEWRERVWLIDFHRFTRARLASFWLRTKDLAQLLYSSSVDGVGLRDLVMFWRAYCGTRSFHLLRRLVVWKANLYRRHNKKREADCP